MKDAIYIIVVILAIGVGFFLLPKRSDHGIMSHLNKDQAQNLAHYIADATGGNVYRVLGTGSMARLISNPSYIVTQSAWGKVQVGFAVTYRSSGNPITHRVKEVRGGALIVQGDMYMDPDPRPVTRETYIGTVIATVPYQPDE